MPFSSFVSYTMKFGIAFVLSTITVSAGAASLSKEAQLLHQQRILDDHAARQASRSLRHKPQPYTWVSITCSHSTGDDTFDCPCYDDKSCCMQCCKDLGEMGNIGGCDKEPERPVTTTVAPSSSSRTSAANNNGHHIPATAP